MSEPTRWGPVEILDMLCKKMIQSDDYWRADPMFVMRVLARDVLDRAVGDFTPDVRDEIVYTIQKNVLDIRAALRASSRSFQILPDPLRPGWWQP